MRRLTLFITLLVWLGHTLFGASQVLNNLSYSQRANSKLVDLSYILNLSQGQTAEISFQFSSDDGLTFPVACKTIRGDVGKGITSGPKSAVWDAGLDWPLNFTDKGRIKATCIVSGGTQPPGKPVAIEFVSVPFKPSSIVFSPSWWMNWHFDVGIGFGYIPKKPSKYLVGKYEITNYQWNEVARWAVNNSYDLMPVNYPPGEENIPRTNVAIKDVIKWLNALSEMNNLTPCYFVDPREPSGDDNGDGKISAGPDDWWGGQEPGDFDYQHDPNFDWSLIPNGKEHYKKNGWINMDPNMNFKWDRGEPWYDRNRNQIFEPQEFMDLNDNGKFDIGQSLVCRVGDISNIEKVNGFFSLWMHTKFGSNGYRLPESGPGTPELYYLSMGGRIEQGRWGEYHDPMTGTQKKGLIYIEEWPWGSASPDQTPNIDQIAITPFGSFLAPQPVGQTKANGYGIYDMVGNVREWTSSWSRGDPMHNPPGSPGSKTLVSAGGSVKKGFEKSTKSYPGDPGDPSKEMIYPSHVMDGSWNSYDSEAGESDIGFRPIRIQY